MWLLAFATAIGAVLWLAAREYIRWSTFGETAQHIGRLYAPHLALVFAWFFAKQRMSQSVISTQSDRVVAMIAIAASAVWNVAVLAPLFAVVFGQLRIDAAVDVMTGLAVLSWLVTAPLGYYFGTDTAHS